MKLLVAIAVSILLNLGLVFIGQGRFVFAILILAGCIWIAAPLFLFSGIFLAIAYRKPHPVMISIGQWMMIASIVVGSTLTAIYLGGRLNDRRIEEAKVYCEGIANTLDSLRDSSGYYPTNLTGLVQQSDLPGILKGGNLYYHSQGTNYSITFADPGGMMNGWDFIGSTKKWSRFD
jgi:hypothetical protein